MHVSSCYCNGDSSLNTIKLLNQFFGIRRFPKSTFQRSFSNHIGLYSVVGYLACRNLAVFMKLHSLVMQWLINIPFSMNQTIQLDYHTHLNYSATLI